MSSLTEGLHIILQEVYFFMTEVGCEMEKVLKYLLFSYIITGGLLLLLALLVYRFGLSERMVSIAVIAIYIGTTFFAGFLIGKKQKTRKFLWGLMMGGLYFLVLVVLSLAVNHSFKEVASNFFSVLVLCAGSGMLGGMLS